MRNTQNSIAEDQSEAHRIPWRPWIKRCITTLIILLLVYVGVTWWAVRGDLSAAIKKFPFEIVLPAVGLVVLGLTLRIVRWHYYVRHLKWDVSLSHSILAFLASLSFTATPGKAGEAVKFVLLRRRHEVPIAAGLGVLIVERLCDLIAVFILAIASLSLMRGASIYLICVALIIVAATAFVSNGRLHGPALVRLARVKPMSRIAHQAARSLDACRQLLSPLPFFVGVGIAIMAWSCEAVAFHQLARSVGIEINPLEAASIFGAATLAGVLSALPGGIGGFEAVMVLLLNRIGIPVTVALPTVVMFRLCTLWFGILLGVICLLGWMLMFMPGRQNATSIASKA